MSRLLTVDEEAELASAIDELANDVDALTAFLDGLKATIADARAQVQQIVDGMVGDAESITAEVHNMTILAVQAAEMIERAGSEASDAMAALDSLLDAADESVSPMFAIADQIEEAATEIKEDVQEFVDGWFSEQREKLDEGVLELGAALDDAMVEPIADSLQDTLSVLTDAVDTAVVDALQPTADALAGEVENLLDEIVSRLTEGDAETAGTNAALQPVIDALRPPVEALIDQVERVTPLASMVGMA